LGRCWLDVRSLDASMGTKVNATVREQINAKMITYASSLKRMPETPRTKINGRKITSVVIVLAMIADPTSRAPSTAASSGASPFSLRRRKIFSSTTMELSTIMPTPRASPPRVIRLSVNPPKKINAKVATIEIGIDREITSVLRMLRRKNSKTTIASPPP